MQLFAKDHETMDKAKEMIENEAHQKDIEIMEGAGPAFEEDVLESEDKDDQ
jgi:hypothetical protein